MIYNKSKMQDIKYSEKDLLTRYMYLWEIGDVDGLNKLISDNPILKYKVFTAYNWNRLINSISDAKTLDFSPKQGFGWPTKYTINSANDLNLSFYWEGTIIEDQRGYARFYFNCAKNSIYTLSVDNIIDSNAGESVYNDAITIEFDGGNTITINKNETSKTFETKSHSYFVVKFWTGTKSNVLEATRTFKNIQLDVGRERITPRAFGSSDSIEGAWFNDYADLKSKYPGDWVYKGVWKEGTNYKKNNLVSLGNNSSYFCIASHASSLDNQPPNSNYWIPAQIMEESSGLQVSSVPPTNLSVGDIYFREI